ncbi:MAG: lipase family protein, partial [Ferruginibacter sp.]
MKYIFFVAILFLVNFNIYGQHLKPGFDKEEFIELLNIGAHTTANKKYSDSFIISDKYSLLYQSAQMGLDNLWQLYVTQDSVAVFSIRGTTTTSLSFLANFYAAMVPAKGILNLDKNFSFEYNLSENEKAAVHTGFLISTAYLARDIIPKIDSLYKNMGIKEFIIAGHSQGGAITYLLTSHLEYLKSIDQMPKDIRFKTCISASHKPGNLFYAYEFENLTQGGWAYNVVNTADWVPEAPFTVQTIYDYNFKNPFKNAKSLIRKQKFPAKIVLRYVYG